MNFRPDKNPSPTRRSDQSPRPSVKTVEVTSRNEGQRVDNFLLSQLKGVPKSKIYRIIRKGEVRVNKKRCKPETKLMLGDAVRIPPVFTAPGADREVFVGDGLKQQLDEAILFEDEHILAVNKPSGLAVHGGSGVSFGLIEALRKKYSENQFLELVHRLDRDTSGVILIAKSRMALRHLHAQFREDAVTKIYHLAVHGAWKKSVRKVDAPLKKNELKSGERIVTVDAEGKPSQTFFRILSKAKHFTLVEARPLTGRTHQIRVHAAFSKCPIVGDKKYIQDSLQDQHGMQKCRLMLHARRLEFLMPDGEKKVLMANYDSGFEKALEIMGLAEEKENK